MAVVWAIVSVICAGIACAMWQRTKKAERRMQEARRTLAEACEFWKWGQGTRVVVRDKLAHENVTNMEVFELYLAFRNGQAFRNAKLLFDNNEFKVYAQGKAEE